MAVLTSRDGGLAGLFRRWLPEAHWQAVETFATGRGVPDANYCLLGAEGWVEFKKVSGWQVEVRPEQVAWAERRARAGGRVFLAARKADLLWVFPAAAFRPLLSGGIKAAEPLLQGSGGPPSWPWAKVRDLLQK